jgi:glycosyltransferase involved in cell wall biosynthesis
MKVSIIIPCYNQAEYLAEAIDSALTQTVKSEVIVVNDGSTDDSLEIATHYPVKIVNQVNKGLASARNAGIMNATGDIILPLDADDILLENCVEKILQKFVLTNADIVAPSLKCFGTGQDEIILMPHPTIDDFRTANRIGYCSAIKKEALLEIGGYSPRMIHGYEDYHVWFNLLTRGKQIETIPEILWLYRTKEQSMWRESLKHHKELMDQIYKDFPSLLPV